MSTSTRVPAHWPILPRGTCIDARRPGADDARSRCCCLPFMGLIDDGDVRAIARQMVGGARPENAGTDRWQEPLSVIRNTRRADR
jgi:hypothetical protein